MWPVAGGIYVWGMFAEAEGEGEGVKKHFADEESEKEKVFFRSIMGISETPHGCKQYV